MWVQGAGGWMICLSGALDVITRSRTMTHPWVNQTTVSELSLSSAVCDIAPP